jgi:hypothetical protein
VGEKSETSDTVDLPITIGGNWVIKSQYEAVGHFSEGLAWVVDNGKIVYIDAENNVVIPIMFDALGGNKSYDAYAYSFRGGYTIVYGKAETTELGITRKLFVLRNPLIANSVSPTPASNLPQYNGLVKGGKVVYNVALAAEGIDNATSAYWQYFSNGQMYRDKGYYNFVYMVDGLVSNTQYSKGAEIDFINGGGSTNAVFCVKDIMVDGKQRTMINISIRGTEQLADWVKDFIVYALMGGVEQVSGTHYGFDIGKQQIVKNETNIYFPTLKKSLSDIVNSAKSDDSEYLIFVNGHNLGAAITNMYVADLYNRQVKINNLIGYDFATPQPFANGYSLSPTQYPIFNIINTDDLVPTVGANGLGLFAMRMGTDMIYYPDETFRKANNRGDIIYRGDLIERIKDHIFTGGLSTILTDWDNSSEFLR